MINRSVVFFGTSQYCIPVLETLNKIFELVLIVTRQDLPVGRKHVLTPTPTKIWAQKHKIPISSAMDIDCDLAIVSDYGTIIKHEVYERPKYGTFNIHFSRLPQLRGPSPVQTTLLRGDTTAWVTIYKLKFNPELAIKMDSGPILLQKEFPVLPQDTTETLYTRLFKEVAKEIPNLDFVNGPLTPQDHSKATFCKMLTKNDGFIDWNEIINDKLKIKNFNKYRAMTPWPGLWTITPEGNNPTLPFGLRGARRMKILKCHLQNEKLVLDEIQFEGGKPKLLSSC